MISELIDNDWLRKHFKETTICMSGSPLFRFEIELIDNLYEERKIELIDLGSYYRVWYYCSAKHGEDKLYYSAPIKDITTTYELYQLTSSFIDESNSLHPTR